MVPIHLGISGGAGGAAEADADGALGGGATTLALAAGVVGAWCSTRV